MPPKAPPEPVPEVVEENGDEPQGPTLFGVQLSEKKLQAVGGLDFESPDNEIRRRNAALEQDQRHVALNKAYSSMEAGSSQAPARSRNGNHWNGRSEGTDEQEKFIRAISPTREEAARMQAFDSTGAFSSTVGSQLRAASPGASRPPGSAGADSTSLMASTGGVGARAGSSSFNSSLRAAGAASVTQASMHRSMTRLFQDLEMANSTSAKAAPRMRCEQVDKMYGWFENHRPKEKKSKVGQAPAFLTYSKDDRVMTGSLRCEPDERRYAPLPWTTVKQTPGWLSRSSSSPSIG